MNSRSEQTKVRSGGEISGGIDSFVLLIRSEMKVLCYKEYKFCDSRRWRFDYAIPSEKVAIEVEGGAYKKRTYRDKKTGEMITTIGGRHNSAKGFLGDIEKYNTATSFGWLILRFTPQDLMTNKTLILIRDTIDNNKSLRSQKRLKGESGGEKP